MRDPQGWGISVHRDNQRGLSKHGRLSITRGKGQTRATPESWRSWHRDQAGRAGERWSSRSLGRLARWVVVFQGSLPAPRTSSTHTGHQECPFGLCLWTVSNALINTFFSNSWHWKKMPSRIRKLFSECIGLDSKNIMPYWSHYS